MQALQYFQSNLPFEVFFNDSIRHYYRAIVISQMVLLSEDPYIVS